MAVARAAPCLVCNPLRSASDQLPTVVMCAPSSPLVAMAAYTKSRRKPTGRPMPSATLCVVIMASGRPKRWRMTSDDVAVGSSPYSKAKSRSEAEPPRT